MLTADADCWCWVLMLTANVGCWISSADADCGCWMLMLTAKCWCWCILLCRYRIMGYHRNVTEVPDKIYKILLDYSLQEIIIDWPITISLNTLLSGAPVGNYHWSVNDNFWSNDQNRHWPVNDLSLRHPVEGCTFIKIPSEMEKHRYR